MAKDTLGLKQPDAFQTKAVSALQWVGARSGIILGGLVVIALIAGGMAAWQQYQNSQEATLQSEFGLLEKRAGDLQRDFDEAARIAKVKAADPKAATPPTTAKAATGDLSKDFGTLPSEFQALIDKAPGSKAGEMAALALAGIYVRYDQKAPALAALQKVNTGNRLKDLTGALVVHQRGNLLAETGDCKAALDQWGKLVGNKQAKFLHDDTKLRMGLCFESEKDFTNAEKMYREVSQSSGAGETTAKDAEKYLRLLKVKQATRG